MFYISKIEHLKKVLKAFIVYKDKNKMHGI